MIEFPDTISVDIIERFWHKVIKTDDCWYWMGGTGLNGYGRFTYTIEGKKKYILPHRFSYLLMNGPIPDGELVCHHCDNPACVNPLHLFTGSQSDNMKDAYRKGRVTVPDKSRYQKGEKHPYAKLSNNQVEEIKQRISDGERQIDIAEDYPVSRWAISKIATGKNWARETVD